MSQAVNSESTTEQQREATDESLNSTEGGTFEDSKPGSQNLDNNSTKITNSQEQNNEHSDIQTKHEDSGSIITKNTDRLPTKQQVGDIQRTPGQKTTGCQVPQDQDPFQEDITQSRGLKDSVTESYHKLWSFFKSDFLAFMAWTTFSAAIAGLGGALIGVYFTKPVNLDANPSTTTPSQPTPTSTPAPSPIIPPEFYETMKAMNESLNQCLVRLEEDQELIRGLNNNLDTMRSDVQDDLTKLTDKVTVKSYIVEEQMSELKDMFVSKQWLLLIFVVGLIELAVVGKIIWVMWQKLTDTFRQKIRERSPAVQSTSNSANHMTGTKTNGIQGDANILNSVTRVHLQNRICVVAFHTETVEKHMMKVKQLLSKNASVTIVQFVVSSVDDILQVPPSILYLVFVDFNERNVILEDPNKGLGNMRLTTVQALDRMGGEVVLTYCRDQGSHNLNHGSLYNTDLTSVRQHSELRRLDNAQRMLSVFDDFNKKQKDHLVQIVKDVLR